MSGKVVAAWLSPGQVAAAFCDAWTSLTRYDAGKRICGDIHLQSGPRIAEARSQIVDHFLQHPPYQEAEWLWMLDSDMTFQPDTLERLMEVADRDEAPIVGGLCFGGGLHRMFPTIYRGVQEDGGVAIEPMDDYPRDQLVKVAATGAACLLVHRDVFVAMGQAFGTNSDGRPNPYPWFSEGLCDWKGRPYGEDTAFCMRAQQLGFPVFVDTRIKLGHVKSMEITEELYDQWRKHLRPPAVRAA